MNFSTLARNYISGRVSNEAIQFALFILSGCLQKTPLIFGYFKMMGYGRIDRACGGKQKKTQKTPTKELARAKTYLEDFLERNIESIDLEQED